jgi:hypothetical protein
MCRETERIMVVFHMIKNEKNKMKKEMEKRQISKRKK